jgi:predicted nuclease with RNAse H fold
MKTELRPAEQEGTFELWYDGKPIGVVQGVDGAAGVMVVSTHPMLTQWHAQGTHQKRVEIRFAVETTNRETDAYVAKVTEATTNLTDKVKTFVDSITTKPS